MFTTDDADGENDANAGTQLWLPEFENVLHGRLRDALI